MTPDSEDLWGMEARLDAILGRVERLEIQVRGLAESQTVEANAYVVKDDRGHPRTRLEVHGHTPSLTFYDSAGTERLKIGLRTDGTPALWVEGRETPLTEA